VLRHWRRPATGAGFLLAVATAAIADLAAVVARAEVTAWPAVAALALVAVALAAYLWVAASFDLRELVRGAGDQWVAGGALAICSLALAQAIAALRAAHALAGVQGALGTADLVIWAAAMAWLPALALAEVARPRLRYDVRRWATVFPAGMYAALAFAVARVERHAWIADFGRLWTPLAAALWAAVAAGALKAALRRK
jgi:hypothetical protein